VPSGPGDHHPHDADHDYLNPDHAHADHDDAHDSDPDDDHPHDDNACNSAHHPG
jgi:hypothetical protein